MVFSPHQPVKKRMNRREFIQNTTKAAAFFYVSRFLGCTSQKKKPNIIILYIDDLGWKDAGFMGSSYYETPNIDELVRTGLMFTDAYANAPNCAPSRACLLTGMYSPRHGVYTVGSSKRGESQMRRLIPTETNTRLDPKFITLAEVLKDAGYTSASIGKWHLGDDPDEGPTGQGFDINIGGNRFGYSKSHFSPYKNSELADGSEGEYLTDRLTREAIDFIAANREGPFFLYLTHYAVHTPIQGKEEIKKKYETKAPSDGHFDPTYAAMIESVDQGIGAIIKTLNKLNLRDHTIIFFLSDNGGYGPITSMEPLRGSKGMLYEGGIRIPLIVNWQNRIKGNRMCDTPVIGTDLFPTILDVLNIPMPQSQPIDGVSLLPLLDDQGEVNRDALFWHFPAYLQAYEGMDSYWRTTPAGAIRSGDWKLIEFFEDFHLELYNLKEDIGESRNLSDRFPEKIKELHDRLKAWRKSVNAPVPTQLNPEYTGILE